LSKGRLEAFSDGVFAIAITLLVLTIAQPTNYRHLGSQLTDRLPSCAAYAVSFAVIGIIWLNHHSIFMHFARIDRALVYLNLLLLLTVVFIPYPTEIFGEALKRGEGETVAAVFYSVVMMANAYSWGALWLYASGRRRLLDDTFPESERRTATVLFTIGTVLYTVTVVIAFINAYVCLAAHAALAVYYALDPLSRRVNRSAEARIE
jgi:uncharacterized membrane protein